MLTCKDCIHTKNKESAECIHHKITFGFMVKYDWNPKRLADKCIYFEEI